MNDEGNLNSAGVNSTVTPINKRLLNLAVIIWVTTLLLTFYSNNLDLLKTILQPISMFSVGCFLIAYPLKKRKVFSFLWKITFLVASWSGFSWVLINGFLKENYFGSVTPYVFLLFSAYSLYISLKYILLEIAENKDFKKIKL
jgi:hypothetical protein